LARSAARSTSSAAPLRDAPDTARVALLGIDALDRAGVDAARALCTTARAAELLERAIAGTPECQARVAIGDGGAVIGLAMHGLVAGASGTGALHWIAVDPASARHGVGRALVARALGELAGSGARLVVAEMSGTADHAPMIALLADAGFEREGDIADFYRDGVSLMLWRRSLR
jgi:ribosomal protein S18 acetylase RimI-like enzyme